MADEKQGLTAALAQLGLVDPRPDQAEQVELFDEPAADAPLPMPPAALPSAKGGRPKGSRNKRTDEWVAFLQGRYRSPLVFLLESYSRTPAELARQLGLYKYHEGKLVIDPVTGEPVLATGEAFKVQVDAAIAALPYLHQKLPMAITVEEKARGLLLLNLVAEGAENATVIDFGNDEQNQQLVEHDPRKSDEQQSDEDKQ